ncbi:hypothetical protein DK926_19370 [Rhodococcus sp. Eu-32]|uniref:hypothetical protein n=1 Tax=Rhodococcus sp. Eu-32 TaxID=1017319 RepID=UPI000DF2A8EC|nr:hypothetical protein [Rhodococcus sp. Eu-32]RRQ26161.1 hypothetical protein DK926_19370 [Rhodococcus sp. Eu-32]
MAFSTTEDEQWFTALPADLMDVPDARSSNAAAASPTDDIDEEEPAEFDDERVVALPPPAAGPQWAAALDNYRTGADAGSSASEERAGTPAAQRSWLRRHRSSMAVTGSIAALIALVGGAALILDGTGQNHQNAAAAVEPTAQPMAAKTGDTSTAADSTAASSSATPPPAEQWCSGQSGGTRALASSTQADLAAIARIEDAYYLTRDIDAVNAQLGGGVVVEPGDFAAAMAAIPAGTDHCVLTSPLTPGQYRVTVIERRPGGEEKRFTSAMTVQRSPDGTTSSIVGIGQVPQ